jgi:hypothetical protein
VKGLDALASRLVTRSPEAAPEEFAVLETASVTAVTPGAAKDGETLVTVSWRGSNITAQYLRDTYINPAVGDLVLLGHHGNVPYIFGVLGGLPT